MDIRPLQVELADFWMTNSIARASRTMAECVKAARQYKHDPHHDPFNEKERKSIAAQ